MILELPSLTIPSNGDAVCLNHRNWCLFILDCKQYLTKGLTQQWTEQTR